MKRRGSVLIVAGETGVREELARGVRARGHRDIVVRETAAEAVQALRSGAFGLVIVHADVGDMAGEKAVPVIRAADPRVRILFATPASSVELEARIREAGVYYYYLYERADSDELAEAVEGAIGPPRRALDERCTILVVDDDVDLHETMRIVLTGAGYVVLGATTIEEGLALARTTRPDLVLLDVVMKSPTDGLLFSRELRRDPMLQHTPILALSAMGGRTAARFSLQADEELFPVDGFLEKPVPPEVLLRRVEALIGAAE